MAFQFYAVRADVAGCKGSGAGLTMIRALVHEFSRKIGHLKRSRARFFLDIGARAVAALDHFTEEMGDAVFGQECGELACVVGL
jgi:hypothetical protein